MTSGGLIETYDQAVAFLVDMDGDPNTRDVGIAGTRVEGSSGWPLNVLLAVVDDDVDGNTATVSGDGFVYLLNAPTEGSLDILDPALYDNGFYNIGVRPTFEDLGLNTSSLKAIVQV